MVGLSADEVRTLVEAEAAGGHAYIVGALASGLGNSASDVDIHVLRPGLTEHAGPRMFRVRGVAVDIEDFPQPWPGELAGRAAAVATVDFPAGSIALESPLNRQEQRRAGRWMHALPLDASSPPVLGDGDRPHVLALLTRVAFDRMVTLVGLARLCDASSLPRSAGDHLWRQAARQLLELRCRLMGDATTGDKWLSARSRRLNLSRPSFTGDREFRTALAASGLPEVDAWQLAALRPATGTREASLAGKSYLMNRHDRLLAEWTAAKGPVGELVPVYGADCLVRAVRRAELDLIVDQSVFQEVVR
ncbi:hypothetical protein [Streptomyces phyllanthi]|uniref:hypothetical protein n=1 Tax=Streptomyces phyllanthi TaxID=1803180 RepID=UPI0031EC8792